MRTNTIEIPEKFSQRLSQLPESGRFLHKVKVTLSNGEVLLNRVVFNSSILHLEEHENISPDEISEIELVAPNHVSSDFMF
jgi:hypothetical protein